MMGVVIRVEGHIKMYYVDDGVWWEGERQYLKDDCGGINIVLIVVVIIFCNCMCGRFSFVKVLIVDMGLLTIKQSFG